MDEQNSYSRLKSRLEDIVVQVRSKDISLEKSLDLYEEALRIGGRCVEQIEHTDFTSDEIASSQTEDGQATNGQANGTSHAVASQAGSSQTEDGQAGND